MEGRNYLISAGDREQLRFLRECARSPVGIEGVAYEFQSMQMWVNAGMQVYEFDRAFSDSILGEKWVDLLPDCIGNRPHDSFYMKLPSDKMNEGVIVYIVPAENIDGFRPDWFPGIEEKGVHIGGSTGDNRAVVNTGKELLSLCTFSIPKDIELMTDATPLDPYPTQLVVNGVAYICSTNADIVPSYKPQPSLRRNNAKRRSQATWHDVGFRVGAELRAYNRSQSMRNEHQGGTVRPHMRRAHWHHFWTGPRSGERKLVLKWLPPTLVGTGKPESPTLHKVG